MLLVAVPTHTHRHTQNFFLGHYFYCFNPCLGRKLQKCWKQQSVCVGNSHSGFFICGPALRAGRLQRSQRHKRPCPCWPVLPSCLPLCLHPAGDVTLNAESASIPQSLRAKPALQGREGSSGEVWAGWGSLVGSQLGFGVSSCVGLTPHPLRVQPCRKMDIIISKITPRRCFVNQNV